MALALVRLWGHTARPWGYEVFADYEDGGRVFNESLEWFDGYVPTAAEIDTAAAERLTRLEASLAPRYTITNADGTVIEI